MITTANINKAIVETLRANFSEVTIVKDLKNPKEPCFYVEYISSNDSIAANNTLSSRYVFNIIYYSKERTLIDLVQIESRLKDIFAYPLRVQYTEHSVNGVQYLNLSSMDSEVDETDYYLEFEIEYNFNQNNYVPVSGEGQSNYLMEKLNISYK